MTTQRPPDAPTLEGIVERVVFADRSHPIESFTLRAQSFGLPSPRIQACRWAHWECQHRRRPEEPA